MVTLELPYDPLLPRPRDPLPKDHVAWVKQRWKEDRTGYLREAGPAVDKMLLAACTGPSTTAHGLQGTTHVRVADSSC